MPRPLINHANLTIRGALGLHRRRCDSLLLQGEGQDEGKTGAPFLALLVSFAFFRGRPNYQRRIVRLLCLPAIVLAAATLTSLAAPYRAESTRRMAERLEKIATEADPMQNPFLNRRAAEIFRQQFEKALTNSAPPTPPESLVGLHFKYAYELLHAGESARAVEQFTALHEFISSNRLVLDSEK